MRVLLDTNIFISHLLGPHRAGTIRELFEALGAGRFTLLLPEKLLEELLTTVRRKPALTQRIAPALLEEFLSLLQSLGELVPAVSEPIPRVTRDPKDDYLLAYALLGAADFLVTGDADLLVLNAQIGNLQIITAQQFVSAVLRD